MFSEADMSDELEPKPASNISTFENKDAVMATYCLNLLAPFNGLTGLAAIVLAYLKRDDAKGTIYESHITYQIRTFWIGLLASIIAFPLIFLFGLGLLLYVGIFVWWMLRSALGFKNLLDGKEITDPQAYLV